MPFFKPLLQLFKIRVNNEINAHLQMAMNKYQEGKIDEIDTLISGIDENKLKKKEKSYFCFLQAQLKFIGNTYEEGFSLLNCAMKHADKELQLLIEVSRAEIGFRTGKINECLNSVTHAEELLAELTDMDLAQKQSKQRTLINLKGAIFSSRGEFDAAIENYKKRA